MRVTLQLQIIGGIYVYKDDKHWNLDNDDYNVT